MKAMKFKLSGVLVLLVSLVLPAAGPSVLYSAPEGEALNWETDWNKAFKDAAAAKRPVLVDFYTDWCPPCKKLAAVTFVDENMIGYFNKENYMLIKINPEKDRVAEDKFKVYSYPTLVVFNPAGAETDRILGFRTAEELIKILEDLKKGIGTLEDLLNRLEKIKEEKTQAAFDLRLEILAKYIARAAFPEALAMVDKIVALDKDNALKQASAALFQKGFIYYKWKKYKEAIDALTAIQKVYPEAAEAEEGYAAAAYYSEKLKDPALTLKILKEYVKLFPGTEYSESARKKIAELEKSAGN